MIARHRKFKCFAMVLLVILICLPHTVLSMAPAPVDYLVPPPLPQVNAVATRFKPPSAQNLLLSESRTIPKFANPQLLANQKDKPPGLMTRVARWFGFANQNTVADNQLTSGTNQESYYYPKPQQQQQYGSGDKEYCYLCNKYPWVPMMPNSLQYPVTANQWDASKPTQLQAYPQHYSSNSPSSPQVQTASSNVKQRAVKFNYPLPFIPPSVNKAQNTPNHIQYSAGSFLPIPIPPILSNSALPPLYNAQNFLPPIVPMLNTMQELPSTKQVHFSENVAEHSEIHTDTVIPTQIPPTIPNRDASFEIVKSHQLVDYLSSIEYPASYVPSHSYDVSTQVPISVVDNHQASAKINAGFYQHSTFTPHLSQHVPASQLLTEPGNFRVANQQPSVQQSDAQEQTTVYEADSYVAASQRNSSVFNQQQHHNTNSDAWTVESSDFTYATSTPETFSATDDTSILSSESESTTQLQTQDNEIEFLASIQTTANAQHSNIEPNKLWPQKAKQRETPKRLLDSPIQHVKGNLGAPRPFTRDPSDLTFRLKPTNHKFLETDQVTTNLKATKIETAATESPTSPSTFSSIDASGQYAGISPPSLPSTYNTDKLILPYLTTKNRPRPFESTRVNVVTKPPPTTKSSYSTWNQNQNLELHTPQESMLIKSHIKPVATTTTTTAKPRTTKYLSKILASNLRELLQREHEPTKLRLSSNSLDIDINKLQKNIDDWTEQEYTSLSHRPSTPTIRGRSKNIPSEYLPTTAAEVKASRQSKTTKMFADNSELPSSINNLEPLYERESTKHSQYTQITDNHLRDIYTNFESMKSNSSPTYKISTTPATTTTTSTATTTTEKTLYLRPIQNQEPAELWKKAKVSISPKTQEKVYVVTPQPRFFPQRLHSASSTTTEKSFASLSVGSGFKSPRFLMRPTPGNDTQSKENSKENMSSSYFKSEWFGLRGLSAYVPSEPVEIIDGNSKVLNIVTPPSNLEKTTTRHNIMDLTKDRYAATQRKATMAPSPR